MLATRKRPVTYKKELLRSAAVWTFNCSFLSIVIVVQIYYMAWSLARHDWFNAIGYAAGLLFVCYCVLPNIVYSCLEHYLYNDYNHASRVHSQAIKWFNTLPVLKWPFIPALKAKLGLIQMYQGNYKDAELLCREALTLAERSKTMISQGDIALYHYNLGIICERQNNYLESELQLEQALNLAGRLASSRSPMYRAWPLMAIGALKVELGELERAEEHVLQALKIFETVAVPGEISKLSVNQEVIACNLMLALINARQNDLNKSEVYCERFFLGVRRDPNAVNTLALRRICLLADEYLNRQVYKQSEQLLVVAYSVGQHFPFHIDSQEVLKYFEKLLLLTNRQSEIADMHRWLHPVHDLLLATDGSIT